METEKQKEYFLFGPVSLAIDDTPIKSVSLAVLDPQDKLPAQYLLPNKTQRRGTAFHTATEDSSTQLQRR